MMIRALGSHCVHRCVSGTGSTLERRRRGGGDYPEKIEDDSMTIEPYYEKGAT